MSFCKHRVMDKCKKDGKLCIYRKACFEPEEQKPQTNADYIRSMTDEELAVAICQTQDQCSCCELTETDGSCTETLCVNAMIRWLKQPYKEDT